MDPIFYNMLRQETSCAHRQRSMLLRIHEMAGAIFVQSILVVVKVCFGEFIQMWIIDSSALQYRANAKYAVQNR